MKSRAVRLGLVLAAVSLLLGGCSVFDEVGSWFASNGKKSNLRGVRIESSYLLEYLLRHSDRVVSREMLARDVWRATARATPLDNVIDVTIARLRRKIDEPYERKLLHTVRGLGYLLSGRQG